ncbi:hypothetical protein SAMD00079811_70880 [Scytonema sp. HK-05]|nr:hypothetical protein SAMD00079811_70880 [Scytonema sp. HK-05]
MLSAIIKWAIARRWLVGLRQKTPRKKPQIYIQKDFDIVLLSLLIYLGFGHF